ncbi:hypothetical protein PsorP6_017668 [Peronosclerospora sorghi]|uniref:Uncharacterized protein n=1 Tax=Peronosclerospora sorghi TaxID=230839 RepID=A0ACC0WNG5_9STRA|nr:hypothetical protein PsorP6_017668 [Peronosclerospora sorghi]
MTFKRSGSSKKVSSIGQPKQKHGFLRTRSLRGSNPFDVRSNAAKQKHHVIGRRVKGAGRNVAAARSDAERKRRKTLGEEFRARHKSNVFKDKRLGEQDPSLSLEDKMMARFQTERKRKMRKASVYALHDSDSDSEDEGESDGLFLTHKGARIADDDYDKLNPDERGEEHDDDASDERQRIEAELVSKLHFGGGETVDNGFEKRKTHKEVMHEVMMKAKLFKAERQKHKTFQEDATEQLDEGFADLRTLLEFRPTRASGPESVAKEPMDDFDQLTREFAFEAKAKATERRMSPEEVAAKERDRLAKLEMKRVARMHGTEEESESESGNSTRKRKKSKTKTNDRRSSVIVMPPTDDDLTDDYAVDARFAEVEEREAEQEDEKEEESEAADSDQDSEEPSDDEDESEETVEKGNQEEEEGDDEEEAEIGEETEKQQRLRDAEAAAAELPFVFECPETIEKLAELFKQHARTSSEKRGLILQRIVTYYNPRLSVENKAKMKRFFVVMMRQFLVFAARYAAHKQDVRMRGTASTFIASISDTLDLLAKTMFTVAQEMGDTVGIVVRELLAQLFKRLHKRATTCPWPALGELLLFKALTSIFPTSDLRHNVISSMETLLGDSLARGVVNSPQEATQALFAVSLSLDMTRSKERFMPEVVTFLTRLVRCFVTPSAKEMHVDGKGSMHWLRRDFLAWRATHSDEKDVSVLPRVSLTQRASCTGMQVLSSCLALVNASSSQYASLASFDELFYPLYLLLHAFVKQVDPLKLHPVHAVISALHARLESCWTARRPLRLQTFAPTMVPTFAPQFDEKYTVRKDKTAPKDKAQLKQLQRQVKRARKGAARELRRDAEFLHREKQKEDDARRAAKEAKQKEIRRWLDEQNATFNQQVRKGGHMLKGGGSARGPQPRARTVRQ